MSIVQRVPFWKENENWRARQQTLRDQMDILNQLTENMATANAERASGLANIVAQATLKRVQQEAAARMAKVQAEQARELAEDRALQAVKDRMSLYIDKTV